MKRRQVPISLAGRTFSLPTIGRRQAGSKSPLEQGSGAGPLPLQLVERSEATSDKDDH